MAIYMSASEYTINAHPNSFASDWRYFAVYVRHLGNLEGRSVWVVVRSRESGYPERLDVDGQWVFRPEADEYDRWRERTEFDEQQALKLAERVAATMVCGSLTIDDVYVREEAIQAGVRPAWARKLLEDAAAGPGRVRWPAAESDPDAAAREAVVKIGMRMGLRVVWNPVGEFPSPHSAVAQTVWELTVARETPAGVASVPPAPGRQDASLTDKPGITETPGAAALRVGPQVEAGELYLIADADGKGRAVLYDIIQVDNGKITEFSMGEPPRHGRGSLSHAAIPACDQPGQQCNNVGCRAGLSHQQCTDVCTAEAFWDDLGGWQIDNARRAAFNDAFGGRS